MLDEKALIRLIRAARIDSKGVSMLSITTDKQQYMPGDIINIEVRFTGNKTIKARSLSATLWCAERKRIQRTRVIDSYDFAREKELGMAPTTNVRTETLEEERTPYERTNELAGSREYNSGETFSGKFIIPGNAPATSHEWGHDNKIDIWKLKAKLDIAWAPDENSEIEIFVGGLE